MVCESLFECGWEECIAVFVRTVSFYSFKHLCMSESPLLQSTGRGWDVCCDEAFSCDGYRWGLGSRYCEMVPTSVQRQRRMCVCVCVCVCEILTEFEQEFLAECVL